MTGRRVTSTSKTVTPQVKRLRIVGYLRVSTREQAENGYGLDVQEHKIRAWAKQNGHRLLGFYRDEGESGSLGLADRIGLADALADIRDGRADGIVVWKLDRFSRDAMLAEHLLREVWRMGGEVYSTAPTENDLRDDPDDPARKLFRRFMASIAEYEKDMVVLRLRMGRRRKAERGGYAYGAPHYGVKAKGGELIPHRPERAAIARMRELRDAGASYREIAAVLDAEGHRPKRSARWHPQTVRRALTRAGIVQPRPLQEHTA